MTNPDPAIEAYERLLQIRDETRAAINDERIDKIRDETRQSLIKVMRRGISRLESLGAKDNPARAARVKAEVEWMKELVKFMGGLNS